MLNLSLWERVTKSGPWGLVVIIVLVAIGQSVGLLPSEAKDAKAVVKDHMVQQERAIRESQETNSRLAGIEVILRENQLRAGERDRILCLNAAKTPIEVERCAKIK